MSIRLERLRAALSARDLPALLVSGSANRRYLSGFSGSSGALLVSHDAALLFTDGRYVAQVEREAPGFGLRQIVNPGRPLAALLAEALAGLGLARIAVEAAHMSLADYHELLAGVAKAGLTCELVPSEDVVEGLRARKDDAELDTLRRAVAITDAAITAVIPQLRPEMSERQAGWMLEQAMRDRGADGLAFELIVAAGPNSALPHARPGADLLGSGRPIVIDMGARLGGYHADLTRTIVIGEPDGQFWEIYNLVYAAQRRAIAGMRPGLSCAEADALAREHIAAAGHAEHFSHGLGHGVGLNIHELPGLRAAPEGKPSPLLESGMVTSVEPGIYLPGWGGVRIEDLVLITPSGHEVLSQAPMMHRG